MIYDIVVIGAGVIGSMIARELTKYNLTVCILEKENDVATGASKANSGIIHGGYDPEPGTLKAKLNVEGVEKLFDAAKELNVPNKRCGSFICAFSTDEDEAIKELYDRGIKNGVKDMRILSGDEARAVEPNLSKEITSVLSVPTAGIVCPYEMTIAAVGNAMDNGAELLRNFCVTGISKNNGNFEISSSDGQAVEARYIINCAGVYSDKISSMIGDSSFKIIPRAGEYLLLDKLEGTRVTHTIFQVPTKAGKGILVTPTVDGNLLAGPTSVVVECPESTKTTQSGIDTVIKFASKSVPTVAFRSVITSFCGVRASQSGGDFIIGASACDKDFINVAAIDSPGLTSCVSIAEYVVNILKENGAELTLKSDWYGKREDPHAFRHMNDEQKNEYIKKHPEYGKIVCRCERVSEGEIRDAIRRNPPAYDIDGVKRRTRAGMGRCQGGFCGPYVMKIISEETGISMQQVTKNGKNSEMVIGKI